MQEQMPVTQVSNEPALRQYRSEDGDEVISIVAASERSFRFVVDAQVHEPATPFKEAHRYWSETYRSGLYLSAEDSEREAVIALPWLRSLMSR